MIDARTPLHDWHAAHGARFASQDGWQVVSTYRSAEEDAQRAQTGLGLADLSASRKLGLIGQGIPRLSASLAEHPAALEVGRAEWLYEKSVLACRLTVDRLMLFSTKSCAADFAGLWPSPPEDSIVQAELTSTLACFLLVGPGLEPTLRRLAQLDTRLSSFPLGSCAETSIARVEALLVRIAEYELPSLRIYVPWDLGEYVWERILEAGHDLRVVPLGLDDIQSLNIP